MQKGSEAWLAILGLGPAATQKEIKEAYRDLARVWHPDRFTGDPRLQKKAEETLQKINGAFERLRPVRPASTSSGIGTGRAAGSTGAPDQQAPQTPAGRSTNRPVRLVVPHREVRIDDRRGTLVDLSVSGAQLLLDFVPSRERCVTIRLQAQRAALELPARVVRATLATPSENADPALTQWTVGVMFVGLSPQVRRAIPRFYNLLVDTSGEASNSR
jgi:hypothetical protein